MDFLFQQPKPEDLNNADVMIVGTSDGSLHLSIYDSFVIGTFPYPPLNLIYHASHPQLSSQCLVMADKLSAPSEISLVPMDLPFITASPISLSLLASKLTTLQKLQRYLKQTQLHMLVEWKNARELPSRFLRSVEGDLEDMPGGPRETVAALYHTVVTGHAYGPVKEWLVDSLAERVSAIFCCSRAAGLHT
jgi:anaphase-promoting complex subunit 4